MVERGSSGAGEDHLSAGWTLVQRGLSVLDDDNRRHWHHREHGSTGKQMPTTHRFQSLVRR